MTGAGSSVPRKEDSDHAGATGETLHDGSSASDVTESLDTPGKPDSVRVLVQNADGTFDVTIAFEHTSITQSGGSGSPVDLERAVPAPGTVTVTISDTSAASNAVDYDILVV